MLNPISIGINVPFIRTRCAEIWLETTIPSGADMQKVYELASEKLKHKKRAYN